MGCSGKKNNSYWEIKGPNGFELKSPKDELSILEMIRSYRKNDRNLSLGPMEFIILFLEEAIDDSIFTDESMEETENALIFNEIEIAKIKRRLSIKEGQFLFLPIVSAR